MHLQKAYERVPNFEQAAAEAKLRFVEWKIIFTLDGLITGADVALAFGLTAERTHEIFERLVQKGVIAEIEISLADYLERVKPSAISAPASQTEAKLEMTPPGRSGIDALRTESDLSLEAANISASITRRSPFAESPNRGANGHSHTGSPSNAAISFSLKKRFRLKSVLDFIQGHAGGGTLGQLAVYRTLMLIPGDLLRETGLRRLDFNDATVEIDSPKLRKAIVDALGKTLRVELPVGYFLE